MAAGSFVKEMTDNLGFTPTEDQSRLFAALEEFGGDPASDIMVVAGYAGTGKTSAIAAFVKTLHQHKYKYVLLAPTGRAAKVLSGFTCHQAYTIHKHIYRQKSLSAGFGKFSLDINRSRDTFFIIDEASLITIDGDAGGNVFGSGDLLQGQKDPPFVGAGVLMANRFKGVITWEGYWMYKIQFAHQGVSAETRRDRTAWQHDTINGDTVAIKLPGETDVTFFAHKEGMTETAATAWLKAHAGISDSSPAEETTSGT